MKYILILLIFLGCGNEGFKEGYTPVKIMVQIPEVGKLRMKIHTESDFDFKLKIDLKNNESGQIIKKYFTKQESSTILFENLVVGTYNVNIVALQNSVVFAIGSGFARVLKNKTNTFNIDLKLITANLNINVTIKEDLLGTRDNPFLFQETINTPNKWIIQTLKTNKDAWPIMELVNQSNNPPTSEQKMILIKIKVINNDSLGSFRHIFDSDFSLIGSHNILYTFSDGCGVIPNKLVDNLAYKGQTEGNICFTIPKTETDLLLAYEHEFRKYQYFKIE